MASRVSLLLRRSTLALAVAQVMVCTLAPLHDQGLAGEHGPVRVERTHSGSNLPAHDPDTCPLCQLMNAQLLRPEVTRLAAEVVRVQRPQDASTTLPVARAPPPAHQPRAPPTTLA